jgi:hypothetical protein
MGCFLVPKRPGGQSICHRSSFGCRGTPDQDRLRPEGKGVDAGLFLLGELRQDLIDPA